MHGPQVQPVGRTELSFNGERLVSFSGCDYFRFSSHPRVVRAAARVMERSGLSISVSRGTTGNHPIYASLEEALARFFSSEAALLTNSGYTSNLVVAQGLAGDFDRVLIDERAHPSLRDAALFFEAPVQSFRHLDAAHAHELASGSKRVILLTDGVFAFNGATAPLAPYLNALGDSGWILVDDAHGAGVVGPTGRGTVEFAGISRERIIQTITLSKALGAFGGAILGGGDLLARILARSRASMGSTPVPPACAAAALESILLLSEEPAFLARLRANTLRVKTAATEAGVELPRSDAPVVCVAPQSPEAIIALKERLFRAGIYPPLMKYFGGSEAGFFRFVLSSEHTPEQIGALLSAMDWR